MKNRHRDKTNDYSKRTPPGGGIRIAIVLVATIFWIAVVNNCELAALAATTQQPQHSCCEPGNPADTTPANQDQPAGGECCRGLHPVALSANNTGVDYGSPIVAQVDVVASAIIFDAVKSRCSTELDTGPPEADSFAEVVLQRSVLVHAPPSLS